MDEKIDWTAIHIAEFEARRKEIMFRLECLQRVFEQTIITTGIVVTILGLYIKEYINIIFILLMLLVSTLIFFFLQLSYLKHHYWLLISANYEEWGIRIKDDKNEIYPFQGYDVFVDTLNKSKGVQSLYLKIIGYFEAAFPTAMGFLNLVLFWILLFSNLSEIAISLTNFFLFYFGYTEIIFFIILVMIGITQRNWAVRGKKFVLK